MKSRVFQLIDLDRTLFDTSKFVKAVTDEVDILQPGFGTKLDERFEEAYQKEETFFLLRYLRHEKGDAWFEAMIDRVVEKHGADSFLISGARERLEFANTISDVSPSWGVLTYGDEVDQYMKMRLIGLEDAPVYFSSTPDKANIIQAWKKDDGTFQLPDEYGGLVVDELTLEDDKLRAFQDLPEGVEGFWVAAPGKKDHGVSVAIPEHVTPVKNLFEIIDKLKISFN